MDTRPRVAALARGQRIRLLPERGAVRLLGRDEAARLAAAGAAAVAVVSSAEWSAKLGRDAARPSALPPAVRSVPRAAGDPDGRPGAPAIDRRPRT